MRLYEIKNEYLAVLDQLNNIEDLDEQIIKDTLAPYKGSLEEKMRNIAAFIQNLEAEAAAMKQYEDTMNKKRKAVENKIQRIREYIKYNMIECGISSIKSPEFNINLKPAPSRVVIDDELKIPHEFIEQVTIANIKKKELKEFLSNGGFVEGAHLEKSYALTIK